MSEMVVTNTSISIANLSKNFSDSFKTVEVFNDFCLDISSGEFVVIFGPNGCGKSTLLYIISGLEKSDQGTVSFGESIFSQIGFVFQNYGGSLFDWLNVYDNILLPLKESNKSALKQIEQKMLAFFKENNLKEIEQNLKSYPYQLSGGQKQLVVLVRALLMNSPIILLDEPLSSLDIHHKTLMYNLLQEQWLKKNNTTILVSHELDEALLLASRLILVSPKPMKVVKEWNIDFARPRNRGLLRDPELIEIRKDVLFEIEKIEK